MSMKCGEALQARHAQTRCPPVSTWPGHCHAANTRKCPWGRKGWHSQAALMTESAVSHSICQSHTWQEGAPHRVALTLQIPTQPLPLAAFQSRIFTRINCSWTISPIYKVQIFFSSNQSCRSFLYKHCGQQKENLALQLCKMPSVPPWPIPQCWWRAALCSSRHRVSLALWPCTPTLTKKTCTRDPVL